jgi:Right handed beta helix region
MTEDKKAVHSKRRGLVSLAAAMSVRSLLPLVTTRAFGAKERIDDPATIRVGLGRPVASIAEAARIARDGSRLLIDAGEYVGDVAVWRQNDLTILADGHVRMIANGEAAEEKAIWVVKGGNVVVEGIEFTGARVPDRNGAGIRHEGAKLVVRRCRFLDNETGILSSSNPQGELEILGCEFGHNGAGDGLSHNLYVGANARLTVRGSYFHHGRVGHLLKSRAERNDIRYNRLTDEEGGRASYELELPNGGFAVIVGNIVEQSDGTENPDIISFGAEGLTWARNEVYLVNNTIINDYAGDGRFVRIRAQPVRVLAQGNLLAGKGANAFVAASHGDVAGNIVAKREDFVAPERYDYRLRRSSRLASTMFYPTGAAIGLQPDHEYVHPARTRRLSSRPLRAGASQSLVP